MKSESIDDKATLAWPADFETKYIVDYLFDDNLNTRWFLRKQSGKIPKISIKFKKMMRMKSVHFRTAFSAELNYKSYK